MDKPLKTLNWGKLKIDFSSSRYHYIQEMRPTEIHLKEDGSINNKPSFAIVMSRDEIGAEEYHYPIYGQISLEMLNEGLKELGYEIVKLKK